MKKHSLVALVAVSLLAAQALAAPASAETIKNLNAAHRGESNAHHRYLAFARQADTEGHAQVAKLFRAAAAAEAIHRDTHRATIQKLGGAVEEVVLDPVTPGSTADNLREAIKGENYEQETMYPAFLQLAKAEDAREAVRSFHFAVSAEKEHARLYADALAKLGQNTPADYYVCPVCGKTTVGRPGDDKCGTCRQPTSKFNLVG